MWALPCCLKITSPLLTSDIFSKNHDRNIIFLQKGVKCYRWAIPNLFKSIPDTSGRSRPNFNFFSISKNALFQWFTNRQNPHSWVDFASFNTRISTKFFNSQLEWLHSLFYTKSMSCCVCAIGGASQTRSNVFFCCFSRCSTSGWDLLKLSENSTSASWQSCLQGG